MLEGTMGAFVKVAGTNGLEMLGGTTEAFGNVAGTTGVVVEVLCVIAGALLGMGGMTMDGPTDRAFLPGESFPLPSHGRLFAAWRMAALASRPLANRS